MVWFNRLLNLAVLAMAITTVIFTQKLSDKRTKILNESAALDLAITKAADTIAEKSKVESISIDPSEESLAQFQAQVDKLLVQRDALANKIVNVANNLKLASGEVVSENLISLKDAEVYNKTADKAVEAAAISAGRHQSMVESVSGWASTLGLSIDTAALDSVDGYQAQLAKMTADVQTYSQRGAAIADGIKAACDAINNYSWNTPFLALNDATDYNSALEALKTDMEAINKELQEVVNLRDQLADTETQLADAKESLDERNKLVADLNKDLVEKANKIDKMAQELAIYNTNTTDLNPDAEFFVKGVDNAWEILTFEMGDEKMVPDVELLVARGDKYIGAIHVTKILVEERVAVAEIKSSQTDNKIQPGDKIFYAPGQ